MGAGDAERGHESPELPPVDRRPVPIISVVGLVALALALGLGLVTQIQNESATDRVEELQQAQFTFQRLDVPATRQALCNLLQYRLHFDPKPTDRTARRARLVLAQNARRLKCPDEIRTIPAVPETPP